MRTKQLGVFDWDHSILCCTHACHLNSNSLAHQHRCTVLCLQVAMRTNQLGVFYWDDTIPMAALLEEGGTIDGQTFLASWRALPQEAVQKLDVIIADIEAAKARLGAVNLFVLAHRPVSDALGGMRGIPASCRVWLVAQRFFEECGEGGGGLTVGEVALEAAEPQLGAADLLTGGGTGQGVRQGF
jgi:hypothetical protein